MERIDDGVRGGGGVRGRFGSNARGAQSGGVAALQFVRGEGGSGMAGEGDEMEEVDAKGVTRRVGCGGMEEGEEGKDVFRAMDANHETELNRRENVVEGTTMVVVVVGGEAEGRIVY